MNQESDEACFLFGGPCEACEAGGATGLPSKTRLKENYEMLGVTGKTTRNAKHLQPSISQLN